MVLVAVRATAPMVVTNSAPLVVNVVTLSDIVTAPDWVAVLDATGGRS
jgi:hypothetical protein